MPRHPSRSNLPDPPSTGRNWAERTLTVTIGLWALGIGLGLHALWSYAHAAGRLDTPPRIWPSDSAIAWSQERPVLLLFAHPHCPCTRASLRELERLMARLGERVETHIVFTHPQQVSESWSRTPLRRMAADIPNVRIHEDRRSVESDRFRAVTSGFALLYSSRGELQFHGGLTASRGHEGDNAGVNSLAALVQGRDTPVRRTCVYGCPLQTPSVPVSQESPR